MPRPKKKIIEQPPVSNNEVDFVVINTSSKPTSKEEHISRTIEAIEKEAIESAVRSYDFNNKLSSAIIDDKGTILSPTIDTLELLAEYPQNSLKKIMQINAMVSKRINMDDIIGKVVESIYVNINDDYRLSYKSPDGRNKVKQYEEAKKVIEAFNDEVNIKGIIREKTTSAYAEGNAVLCLRGNNRDGWCIDSYPLEIAIVAPYTVDGNVLILIDINELKNRLIKDGFKLRNGKDMFFPTVEDAIKENYPPEVYAAYKNKEAYAKLDVARSDIVRIGNLGRRYGLTPIFRALSSSLILQSFYKSDETNSRARGKKILLQIMRQNATITGPDIPNQSYAHSELVKSYKQQGSVVYTAPHMVEDVKYVEPTGTMIDTKTIAFHLNREMSTLGIGFLSMESANQSVSTAKLSLEQLMKTINAITSQLERIFKKFYRVVLEEEGFDVAYVPTIKILDSEYLEFSLRKELSQMLYTMFNGSLRTSLDLVGIDLDDELEKRLKEQKDGVEKIFAPRLTAYTNGGDSTPSGDSSPDNGRPSGDETDKQKYDEEYTDNVRK